jgi:hypothetical protein
MNPLLGKQCFYLNIDMTVWEAELTLLFGVALLIVIYKK